MATVEVYGDATRGGEWAAVRLVVDGDRVVAADAPGLDVGLAGRTLIDAARVGGEPLAVEALASALGQVFVADPDPDRVAVAMSSGVDSAVTLLRAAPNTIGVTLRLWQDPDGPSAERVCCSPNAVSAARATCHALGVPHVTLDLREEFRETVVAHFVAAYGAGDTPNPCTRCNGAFRFDALLAFAARAGASMLHTGHYARVAEHRGRRLIGRALDTDKDQSYMLASLDPALLDRVSFPLGEQTKDETRAEAARAGLAAAGRPESQEACFLAGGDYREFLERQGMTAADGPIVDPNGHVLGRHDGYWRFTPGQRRGIGVVAERPLYVLRTDAAANAVVVARKEDLGVRRVQARGRVHVPAEHVEARLRHRSRAVGASLTETPEGFALELETPVPAVATGQLAALYEADAVVGAGVVTDVSRT